MKKGTVVILIAVVAAGFYVLGGLAKKGGSGSDKTADSAKADAKGGPADGIERYNVPLEGTPRGAATAKINIVAFSDFQSPFCSRVVPTMEKIMKDYNGQVRLWFRHNPLPFHQDAPLAAEASLAADAQGKFWEMHDKLFANQANIKRPDLEKYAQELGLDMTKFKAFLDANSGKARIDADMALAQKIGVQGTPNFFINGRLVRGVLPFEVFKKVVDVELTTADTMSAAGTPADKVYGKLMAGARTAPAPAPAAAPGKGPGAGAEVYKVAVGDAPTRGGKEPKVTIVEFSDFQCPFCGRVEPTLTQLEKDYQSNISIECKHNPLPFHQHAEPAAEAAMAADAQGKFWPMHDKLFENNTALDRPSLDKYAQDLGLNMSKFKADLDSGKYKSTIQETTKEGTTVGVNGTPAEFISGRKISGAYPFDTFKKIADEELAKKTGKKKG